MPTDQQRTNDNQAIKRLFFLCSLSVFNAFIIAGIARLLIYLINFITNIFFYQKIALSDLSPANNHLGYFVIIIPVIGGIIVGLMARYGSKAIRGHGIPEAMEMVLTNESRIKPIVTFLKPLSAAISIGSGGPFGAEGPIISTGGAFGSFMGQIFRVTAQERKVLLAGGATAGMAAIFGTPIAAILLAVELLLFEFSPRTIIPVALGCATGAAGHLALFSSQPVFAMPNVLPSTTQDLMIYLIFGFFMGLVSALVTKVLYWVEDAFEHLPIHWMWWPALGGLVVGIIGYFAPHTLGVGYDNISLVLTGKVTVSILITLSVMKFLSWSISLGSGTSGGTMAPLLTIGGATGVLMGICIQHIFPHTNIQLSVMAVVGMASLFAGASRALLTSIVFAFETTHQSNALLPLLGTCTAAYFISYFLIRNTIMTEKIARRGIQTPTEYKPDILLQLTVDEMMEKEADALSGKNTIAEAREWIRQEPSAKQVAWYTVVDENEKMYGIVRVRTIFNPDLNPQNSILSVLQQEVKTVYTDNSLRVAVDMMSMLNLDMIPVVSRNSPDKMEGIITYKNIFSAYRLSNDAITKLQTTFSLRKRSIRIIIHGKQFLESFAREKES
jgi:chloride channel protein, CIC family